jgi:hypothetical protein
MKNILKILLILSAYCCYTKSDQVSSDISKAGKPVSILYDTIHITDGLLANNPFKNQLDINFFSDKKFQKEINVFENAHDPALKDSILIFKHNLNIFKFYCVEYKCFFMSAEITNEVHFLQDKIQINAPVEPLLKYLNILSDISQAIIIIHDDELYSEVKIIVKENKINRVSIYFTVD